MICDGFSNLHDPIVITEDGNALRVICRQCWQQFVIRKDPFTGAPEKRQYAEIFRRDILQGKDPLFYKIYPQHIRL